MAALPQPPWLFSSLGPLLWTDWAKEPLHSFVCLLHLLPQIEPGGSAVPAAVGSAGGVSQVLLSFLYFW
jgi:hypothetical protein